VSQWIGNAGCASRPALAGALAAMALLSACGKPQPAATNTASTASAPAASAAAPATPAAPAAQTAPAAPAEYSMAPGGGSSANDAPGSQDPAGFARYQGSRIVHYGTTSYATYKLPDQKQGWSTTTTIEGAIARAFYLVPPGASSLEVFRNYEQMLTNAGYTQTLAFNDDNMSPTGTWFYGQYQADASFDGNNLHSAIACTEYGTTYEYAVYRSSNGATVALATVESPGCNWGAPDFATPIPVSKGQVVVGIDVIGVKAGDIADAQASKGVFDLYGVYFDTDKTDVKPESAATLDEVASLLKIDRSLRLEVSGHTDNTGGDAHNLQLSQGRAQAVVNALVKTYGIDPTRLVAKGYGDTKPVAPNDNEADKAKNRRVELRKI